MTRYIFGRDAADDLDQIWNYIAQDNISAADRLIAVNGALGMLLKKKSK